MVLLALLAIGLLSLSTTMLRSSSNQNSIAEARANARLALNLALGELQKHAGPDARITASAGLVDLSSNNPHIAGVWSSRRIQPGSPPSARDYSKQGKADLFQKWLVSGKDQRALEEQDTLANIEQNDSVVLVDELNQTGATQNVSSVVRAELVPIQNNDSNTTSGSYAYAVLDEGTKARIDLGEFDRSANGLASTKLGASQRNKIENTELFSSLDSELFQLGAVDAPNEEQEAFLSKFASLKTTDLLVGGSNSSSRVSENLHDFTIDSESVMSNHVDGGLQMDLSFLAENDLPHNLANTRVYDSMFGNFVEHTDPKWSLFHDFARLYRPDSEVFSDSNALAVNAPHSSRYSLLNGKHHYRPKRYL